MLDSYQTSWCLPIQ